MSSRADWEIGFEFTVESAPGSRFTARPVGGPELFEIMRSGQSEGDVIYRCVRRCMFTWHDVKLIDGSMSTHDPRAGKAAPEWHWQLFHPSVVADIMHKLVDRVRPTEEQVGNFSSPPKSGSSGGTSTAEAAPESGAPSPEAARSPSSTTRARLRKGRRT